MQIETEKLLSYAHFGEKKGISRYHIYRLVRAGKLNAVDIDGIGFIIQDDKAVNLQRERQPKTKKAN
jgi:predicted site-specific integrase-resolvase